MPAQDKPYRVYRGGRVKGRVPLARESVRGSGASKGTAPAGPQTPRPRRWGRWVALGLLVLLVLFVAWSVASYLAVASGVSKANDRVPAGVRRQLAKKDGLLVSTPTTILVLGTDGGTIETSDTTLDYLPGRSEREGGLFFSRDPRGFDLRLRPKGYMKP